MSYRKTAEELMIRLEDYPHIPYWFTLRQATALVREATVRVDSRFEPRAVLVFDEKYQLMGILTLRDIITGLEPKFLQEAGLIKMDPSLTVLIGNFFGPKMKEQSQRAVSEVMSPIKITVNAEDPITKPLYLMIKEHIGLVPVMQGGRVVGILRFSDLFGEISKIVLGDWAEEDFH